MKHLQVLYQDSLSKRQPLIIECAFDDKLSDPYLHSYNQILKMNQEAQPNPKPDQDAPSDDPLISTSTRESIIKMTLNQIRNPIHDEEGEHRGGWVFHR